MNFQERLDKDRRLIVLQLLEAADGHHASSRVVKIGVGGIAYDVGRDIIEADFTLLEQHGLVEVEELKSPIGRKDKIKVATLTELGVEVARGRQHPAVGRPV